jgi:hypothetical protein
MRAGGHCGAAFANGVLLHVCRHVCARTGTARRRALDQGRTGESAALTLRHRAAESNRQHAAQGDCIAVRTAHRL